MRQPLWGDLIAAALVLRRVAPEERAGRMRALIDAAGIGDRMRRRLGRGHPQHGGGSLMAAALAACGGMPGQEPFLDDPEYLAALGCALAVLEARQRAHRARRGSVALQSSRCGPRNPRPIGYIERHRPRGDNAMTQRAKAVAELDPVWQRIRAEAEQSVRDEPLLGSALHASLLHHASFEDALAYRFAMKLTSGELGEQLLREIASAAYAGDPGLGKAARADLVAVHERDPACNRLVEAVLFFKGFQAVQAHRVAHWLWREGRRDMALFIQARCSEVFSVDIHPAARIGQGLMIDHAHAIVIGETAVVGNNVSLLHSVTLGGTGKEHGDRHPKIGDGVLIGAGAKVLGNIRIGRCTRVAAGSVVLSDVPDCKTVAGVPARIVGEAGCDQPARSMHQTLGDDI